MDQVKFIQYIFNVTLGPGNYIVQVRSYIDGSYTAITYSGDGEHIQRKVIEFTKKYPPVYEADFLSLPETPAKEGLKSEPDRETPVKEEVKPPKPKQSTGNGIINDMAKNPIIRTAVKNLSTNSSSGVASFFKVLDNVMNYVELGANPTDASEKPKISEAQIDQEIKKSFNNFLTEHKLDSNRNLLNHINSEGDIVTNLGTIHYKDIVQIMTKYLNGEAQIVDVPKKKVSTWRESLANAILKEDYTELIQLVIKTLISFLKTSDAISTDNLEQLLNWNNDIPVSDILKRGSQFIDECGGLEFWGKIGSFMLILIQNLISSKEL